MEPDTIELDFTKIELHEVFWVELTPEPGVYLLGVDLTDATGSRYTCEYGSRPEDPHGLNPKIREWLVKNLGNIEVRPCRPYMESKATDLSIPAGELRMRLIERHQFLPSEISRRIAAQSDNEILETYWEYFTSYDRDNVYFKRIVEDLMGLSPEEVDSLWEGQ